MGVGLGLLAGLGQAAGGLPQGMQFAQQEEDKRRALAQQQQQFEESKFVNVPRGMLPADTQATLGTAPSMRVESALAPILAARGAKEAETANQQQRSAAFANILRKRGAHDLADMMQFGAPGDPEKALTALENVQKLEEARQQRQQGQGMTRAILGRVFPGMDLGFLGQPTPAGPPAPAAQPSVGQPKIQPTGMEAAPEIQTRNAAGSDLATSVQKLQEATAASPTDPRALQLAKTARQYAAELPGMGGMPAPSTAAIPPGGVAPGAAPTTQAPTPEQEWQHEFTTDFGSGKTTMHIKPKTQAATGSEFVKALDQKQAMDEAGVNPQSPQYRKVIERMSELRTLMAPPGAAFVERGSMPWNAQGGQPGAAPGGAGPRVTTPNPPITPEGETEKVGQRNAAILMLESAGKQAQTFPVLESGWNRTGLRVRGWLQGNTPYEALSDEEQAWVTKHEQLRNYFIASQMGLGPFRSPEMQAQLKEIIGKYWSPGTPARLQELANILRTQGEQVQGAQEVGGRRVLPTPPRTGPAPGVPPAAGGGGIQKWGRDAQGNPIRLP